MAGHHAIYNQMGQQTTPIRWKGEGGTATLPEGGLTKFCWFNTCGSCCTLLGMAGRLSTDNSTDVRGHSLLADKTTILFVSMVSCSYVTLRWSQCVWRSTSFALDLAEWRT